MLKHKSALSDSSDRALYIGFLYRLLNYFSAA